MKTEDIDVRGIPVTTVEVKGTYSGGMPMGGPSQQLEGYMLLGAVARGPDANWFFKLTGPEETVELERAAFQSLLDSLRAGG